MPSTPDRSQLLGGLRNVLDELGSPDLSLAMSNDLRPRLLDLLETIRNGDPGQPPAKHVDGVILHFRFTAHCGRQRRSQDSEVEKNPVQVLRGTGTK
jgi:hypothetical protein